MTLFLQEIFLTQGWNLDLLSCRQILYHLTHLYLSYRHCFSFIFIFWEQMTNALFLKMLPHHHCLIPYKIGNVPILILFFSSDIVMYSH